MKKMLSNINESDIELDEQIGKGNVSVVHIAKIKKLNQRKLYAIKIYDNNLETLSYFGIEMNILKNLNNNFLVKSYGTIESSTKLYIVMDLYLGGNLNQLLNRWIRFSDSTARFYAASMIESIEYLHQKKIIHRDIKPSNFLIDKSGYLKLCDFNYSQIYRADAYRTYSPFGMAPERADGKLSFSIDYWSLGICIYYMLTGKLPLTYPENDDSDCSGAVKVGFEADQTLINEVHCLESRDLVLKLCRIEPGERLGVRTEQFLTVRKHRWFKGFDFEALRAQTLSPPIMPHIKNDHDRTYCQTSLKIETAKFMQTFELF